MTTTAERALGLMKSVARELDSTIDFIKQRIEYDKQLTLSANAGGWMLVPRIGTLVKAKYPITPANPTEYFEVFEIQTTADSSIHVRGENTIWFALSMIELPNVEEKQETSQTAPT